MSQNLLVRRAIALIVFLVSLAIWTLSSDLLELIAEQEEILFGLYSRQRFGQLFLGSVILWTLVYLLLSDMKFNRFMFFKVLAVTSSTLISIFAVILGSQWLLAPRYVEQQVQETADGIDLEGIVRHRPPNQKYQLTWNDQPPTHRSYPSAPQGHAPVEIELTTDQYGYRNASVLESYKIVVAGDSYVAGSQVSDHQAWPVLLSEMMDQTVYNLGVSGSDPQVYLNNFVQLGLQFKPETVIFMIYEGNDFKSTQRDAEEKKEVSLEEEISVMTKNSPVTAGLRRFSNQVLELINSDAPVPDYETRLGWMPVGIKSNSREIHYSFKPKRVSYLYNTYDEFQRSSEWDFAADIFRKMKQVAKQNDIRLLIVYAPSKPHVVLPVAEKDIPAQQLYNFMTYREKSLPAADVLKQELFDRLDSQEEVVRDFCEGEGIEFLSTTNLLQQQTGAGVQTYYTYDQHWTPKGNELIARLISDYLQQKSDL